MPKGKKKSKSGGLLHSKLDVKVPTSEEESFADNCSVVSNLSDLRIGSDDETVIDPEEEILITDDFEDKLKEAIDGTLQKSAKGRITCLETVRKALGAKYLVDFVADRKITMADMVERSLKKGRGEEQALAAIISALLCVQLGSSDENEALFQAMHPILLVIVADPTALPGVRAQCATSLGLCCFISSCGTEEVSQALETTMDSLYAIFSASFFKGNGIPPCHKPEISSLHSSALLAWSLLVTLLTPNFIMHLIRSRLLKRLAELLESVDLDLRIAAGETIAVFYELARQYREDFMGDDMDALCDKLRQLATDGQKFRAKKDRRQQRSSFRDILKAIEEGEPPDIRIKFGKEVLYIDSWCHKRQYDAFCQLLRSGMNFHLMENELLRQIFGLGSPISFDGHTTPKKTKFERHIANLAACKARTKSRNKLRDKRADVIR